MYTFFNDDLRRGGRAIRADLAERGQVRAFALAEDLLQVRGYFADQRQYQRWLCTIAEREALRALFFHSDIAVFLGRVTPSQARLLRFLYIDQLTHQQLALVLPPSVPQPAVRLRLAQEQGSAAYAALCAILRADGWSQPHYEPFPPYPNHS